MAFKSRKIDASGPKGGDHVLPPVQALAAGSNFNSLE
jgi:hypothetical protein